MRTAKIGPDLRSVASLQLESFESRVKSSTASTYAAIIFFLRISSVPYYSCQEPDSILKPDHLLRI